MIEFATTIGYDRYSCSLPGDLPVASVAKAVAAAHESNARATELRRERDAADKGIDTAKRVVATQAADLAIKKKKLPKDIRQAVKDAEEAKEDAALALGAGLEAFKHDYYTLIAEVNANRTPLETVALKRAEQSLQRMAAAREAFASAAVEARASFGLLGMFSENDRLGNTVLKVRDPKGSMRGFHVSQALETMAQAVGHSNLELTAYKRGSAPTKAEIEAASDGEE